MNKPPVAQSQSLIAISLLFAVACAGAALLSPLRTEELEPPSTAPQEHEGSRIPGLPGLAKGATPDMEGLPKLIGGSYTPPPAEKAKLCCATLRPPQCVRFCRSEGCQRDSGGCQSQQSATAFGGSQ